MRKTLLVALGICVAATSLTTGCSKLSPYMNKLAFWKRGNDSSLYGGANGADFRGQTGRADSALKPIYFEYDSSTFPSAAYPTLDNNANWIRSNNSRVQLEGNCDARGTADYNYALGQKRAESVRQYLVGKGLSAGSLNTISYGADKPAVNGTDDNAYAMNRRVEFMVFDR